MDQLSELTSLDLSSNQLSGSIPSELGMLIQLTRLFLFDNQLSGSIPSELSMLTELRDLYLSINQLSGSIPSELGNLIQLTRLSLAGNQLSGSIPSELGNLIQLTDLILFYNHLSGSIPSELGMLSELRYLDLSNNFFTELPDLSHIANLGRGGFARFEVQTNYLDFGDLLPNIDRLDVYAPQRPVREGVRYSLNNGDELLLSVNVGGTDNQYQWYKDEVAIMSSTNDTFRIANVALSDAGLYHCEITNPRVASLTLRSIADTVSVEFSDRSLDSLALIALYNSTDGDNWKNSWDLAQPINTWRGIAVANDRVTRIDLGGNQLSGSIPSELGKLIQLQYLNLASNQLTGSIPHELGDLVRLERLILRNNQLSGSIPPELGDLVQLERLILKDNLLNDTIPKELGKLTNLVFLNLARNSLTGTIPTQLGNFPRMRNFVLSSNKLSGAIPEELGNLTTLSQLRLYDNFFTSLPDLSSYINPQDAFEVYLNHLDFEDILPNRSKLRPFETLPKYRSYDPQRPLREGKRYELSVGEDLVVSINKVKGENNRYQWYKNDIPISNARDTFISLTNVNMLDAGLYYCRVTHPGFNITFLRSSEDTVVVDGVTNLSKLTDSLVLVRLYESTDGDNWKNSWDLAQPINTWRGIAVANDRVTRIDLGGNQLSGSIPSELGKLIQLQYLNLASNQLSDAIPPELGDLVRLERLILRENQLTGSIPPELGDLAKLQRLILRDNLLNDTIPKELGKLTNLVLLNLARNMLTGTIPPQLSNFPRMRYFILSSNKLSGAIPEELGNISTLSQLRLYDNFFTELPVLNILNQASGVTFEVQTNYLDFGDLLPNIGRLTRFAPQRPVREGMRYDLTNGDELLLSVNVGGTDNQYQWYKDNVAIMNSNNDTFRIANIALSDAGLYHCEITNPDPGVAGLTLESIADTVRFIFDRTSDSLALVSLYNSTDGDNWTNRWNLMQPINTWYGVTMANDRVTRINLNSNNLVGTIPRELGSLDQLQYLNLVNNQLSGSIPPELGDLAQLQRLILKDNKLNDTIPKELGKLTNLVLLNLARNSLTGTIPPQLSNFPRMRQFILSSNKLSGAIPEELGNLTKLSQLRLYDNFFTSLPDLSHINFPDAFEVYLNHLDFEDMLPNLSRLHPFETLPRYQSYNPQRPLREGQKYELSEGDDLVLTINKVKGENNQYQWYKNDIPISDARDTSISLTSVNTLDAGLYYCRVTHPRFGITFLRSSEDTIIILNSDLGGRLSAQSASYSSEEEEMSVQVYPNPVVDGTIFIRVEHRAIDASDASEPIRAIFYNLVGIEVYREENILLSRGVPYEWFLGDLSRGIYILRLFIDDRVIERRIMMK